MRHQKPLIRRTFLQERFEILMKLQQSGQASFDELTELDEIINRDPKLRHIILEEMDSPANENGDTKINDAINSKPVVNKNLAEKIREFISGWFQITSVNLIQGY